MLSITPVRERISERFPVASFVVSVPPDRYFEVACATDPRLFRGEQRHLRTATNFATSRVGGLLRAPAGQATYIIPPSTLRRFAGAQRLYYAVGSYLGARNESPVLTLALDRVERTPSIQISPDFTGRSLDRGRIGQADARYGAVEAPLVWGGDDLTPARPAPRLGNPGGEGGDDPLPYDDGFDAALWTEGALDADGDGDGAGADSDNDGDGETYGRRTAARRSAPRSAARPVPRSEPAGFEDAPDMRRSGVEPPGYEDAASLPRQLAYGGAGEPDGYEDLPARDRAYGGRRADRMTAPPVPTPVPTARSSAAPAARYGGGQPNRAQPNRAQHHERYGSVGVGRASSTVAPSIAPPVYGDPAGYEDIPDVVRNLGPRRGAAYGNRAAYGNGADALPAPVAPAPMPPPPPLAPALAPASTAGAGYGPAPRFPDFSDELAVAEPLPDTAPALDPDAAFAPADPRHRLRILTRVALADSGSDRYRAIGVDATSGLAWGYVQLAQKYGGLGHALRVCLRRDRTAYIQLFGEHNAAPAADDIDLSALPAGNLLRVTGAAGPDDRLAPVTPPTGGAPVPLWQPPWLDAFRAAGDVQAFQEAQREVADRRFYLPFIDFLRWLGIRSVRGHAMFVDRAIQMGGAGAARWFARTAGPIRSKADLQAALAHLGQPDLASFQAAATVPGVTIPTVDGVFGALTHAALAAALRHAVDSPLPLRTEPEMLAALCADADVQAGAAPHWRIAAQRLHALADDPELVHVPVEAAR